MHTAQTIELSKVKFGVIRLLVSPAGKPKAAYEVSHAEQSYADKWTKPLQTPEKLELCSFLNFEFTARKRRKLQVSTRDESKNKSTSNWHHRR